MRFLVVRQLVLWVSFLNYCFCFVVAIFDLVHDVEVIFYLTKLLTSSGNLF